MLAFRVRFCGPTALSVSTIFDDYEPMLANSITHPARSCHRGYAADDATPWHPVGCYEMGYETAEFVFVISVECNLECFRGWYGQQRGFITCEILEVCSVFNCAFYLNKSFPFHFILFILSRIHFR